MAKTRTKTLHVFIDESGNFDFTDQGTKHFVLTAVSTFLPVHRRTGFLNLRYELLAQEHDLEYFHATEDKQFVRDRFYAMLAGIEGMRIDAVIARKRELAGFLALDDALYGTMLHCILAQIFHRHDIAEVRDIVVVIGALFTGRKRDLILKKLKVQLKKMTSKPYRIYFHRVMADINCQIADYCGWAIYVAFERNERRPLSSIKHLLKHKFQVF